MSNACNLRLDLTNPLAERWARDRSGRLIRGITAQTRASIQGLIGRSFSEGMTRRQISQLIRPLIGLSKPGAEAVLNLRRRLLDAKPGSLVWAGRTRIRIPKGGLTAELLQQRVDTYSAKMLRLRAEAIARTELIAASSEGQRQLWAQSVGEGMLRGDEQREWIASNNERTCEICSQMNGEVQPFDKEFSNGLMGPPAHVMCRCTTGLSREKTGIPLGISVEDVLLSVDDKEQAARLQRLVPEVINKMQLTKATSAKKTALKVEIRSYSRNVSVGGVEVANYDPATRVMTLNAKLHMSDETVKGVLSHELSHYENNTLAGLRNSLERISSSPASSVGKGSKATEAIDSFFRDNWKQLKAEDGYTDYSASWWGRTSAKINPFSGQMRALEPRDVTNAVDETLAELRRLEVMGQTPRYPVHPVWKSLEALIRSKVK